MYTEVMQDAQVALVEQDLGTMQQLITRATETQAQMAGAVVRVSFNSESLPVDEAYAKPRSSWPSAMRTPRS